MLSLSPSRSISEPPPKLTQEASKKGKWMIRGDDGGMQEGEGGRKMSGIQIPSVRTRTGCRKTHAMSLMKSNLFGRMGLHYDTHGVIRMREDCLMKHDDEKRGSKMMTKKEEGKTMRKDDMGARTGLT